MPKDAGNPQVAEAFNVVKTNGTTTSSFLPDATVLAAGPTQFLITFNEPLSIQNGSSGANSILNLANWQLTRNGKSLPNAVAKVQYGFNEAYVLGLSSTRDNKYEAVITFDSDTTSSGSQALLAGAYDLTILSAVQDLFGNGLDGAYTGAAGNFVRSFTVIGDTSVIDSPIGNITAPGNPTGSTDLNTNTYHTGLDGVTPEVAMDGDGDYVVVWQSSRYGDGGDIAFQRYNRFGQSQGVEGTANPHTKTTDNAGHAVFAGNGVQTECAVAMDAYGDFVIVWAGDGTIPGTINSTADTTGIFAQIFDKNGKAVGERIAVNQSLPGVQELPSVAMDASGNFVVTWTTSDDETDRSGLNVYGRRFSIQGLALSDEFRVNTTAAGAQEDADIAMDSAGNFVVAWQSFGQDGSDWGVYAQRYSKTGAKLGGEFQVNYYATDKQQSPSVAMNANGAFVIAYASFNQDGSGYGVYARRYGASGVALDASEFPVSTTTVNWQVDPEVGIATNGNFVVTWSSFGQDNTKAANPTNDYGIYARMFNANGTEMTSKAGNTYGEFRINAATVGDQTVPCVAMSPAGDTFIVAWASAVTYVGDQPSGGMPIMKTDMEVFSRLVDPVIGSGPQIGSVVVAPADGLITWNAVDPDGVTVSSITIDGTVVSKIYGPMGATSGVNFAAVFGKLATGSHSFTITATDKLGNSSTYDGSFIVAANAGPTIGNVAVAAASGLMTWNAIDADGVASSTVKIDGVTVPKIYGPMTAASGVNFAAVFGTLATGTHQYIITATDKAGNSSTLTANFDVAAPTPGNSAPTISSVAVAQASGMMTWNVADPDGVASSTVTVDGLTVSKLYGPMTAASGVNYAGVFGTLATGEHSYTITATDRLGNASTSAGKFTVETTTNPGPAISSVAVSQANGIITWNALDADGIASSTVTIDNKAGSKIYGPMTAASGSNFAGTLGTLAAGNHAYVITATDRQGNISNLTGNFTVTTIANPGPTIGSVALSLSSGVITWNTIDTDGVRAASLTIDGANVSKLYGPMSASSGVNFAGVFGTLTSGSHSYIITATDTLGNSSTYNGQFSVAGSSGGSVYSVAARGAVMSAAATKIASSAKVDWLCDLPALSPASKDASSDAEDAVDAVMASY
ncbi:MAG: hypothetical protein LLG00_09360, partial [Planctomycetaceae bacterium]|nr:hypothetical protein [Planctomycetaceae bacterium]